MKNFYTLTIKESETTAKTNAKTGLSHKEAKARLEKYGKNIIKK